MSFCSDFGFWSGSIVGFDFCFSRLVCRLLILLLCNCLVQKFTGGGFSCPFTELVSVGLLKGVLLR